MFPPDSMFPDDGEPDSLLSTTGVDWRRWRAARISETGRKGFAKRPIPMRSWIALLQAPISKTTWPYSAKEIETIRSTLPEHAGIDTLGTIVRAAQFYIYTETRSHRAKSNPNKEIKQLRTAIAVLFDALMNLSPEAKHHLQSKARAVGLPNEDPFSAESLRKSVDQFEFENRTGLEQLPAAIRGGARQRVHDDCLRYELKNSFDQAHGGKHPSRGYPKFFKACVEPLKDFGLRSKEERAWRDASHKRRKNLTKNR